VQRIQYGRHAHSGVDHSLRMCARFADLGRCLASGIGAKRRLGSTPGIPVLTLSQLFLTVIKRRRLRRRQPPSPLAFGPAVRPDRSRDPSMAAEALVSVPVRISAPATPRPASIPAAWRPRRDSRCRRRLAQALSCPLRLTPSQVWVGVTNLAPPVTRGFGIVRPGWEGKGAGEEGLRGLLGERSAHVHYPLRSRLRLARGEGGRRSPCCSRQGAWRSSRHAHRGEPDNTMDVTGQPVQDKGRHSA
jgi:hypothetical protein